jgi:hypothetical protein
VSDADGRTVRFADGTSLDVETVIWATGYRSDYSWIHTPGVAREGQVIHRRGVTDVPGLYFVGLSWQYTRGSALLGFVNDDAVFLTDRIAARHHMGELQTSFEGLVVARIRDLRPVSAEPFGPGKCGGAVPTVGEAARRWFIPNPEKGGLPCGPSQPEQDRPWRQRRGAR